MEWLNRQQGKLESIVSTMRDMEQHRMGGFRVEFRTLPRNATWLNVIGALQLGCTLGLLVFPQGCIFGFGIPVPGKTMWKPCSSTAKG